MKKLLLISILGFLFSCARQKEGYITNYYIFPAKKSEGFLKDNLKEGVWKYYNPNGTISAKITYSKGIENGPRQEFSENGKLSSDAFIKNGNFVGFVRFYYSSGKINSEEYYDEHSLSQGKFKIWYESGKLRQVGNYVNGKIVGNCINYYQNGNIEDNEFYDSLGEKDSIWTYYSTEGKLIKREKYKADSLLKTEVLIPGD